MSDSAASRILGGTVVVSALRAHGISVVFGVPGGQTLAITDAILAQDGIRFVATRHEGAAACMADAMGRIEHWPGVCLATTGPGATNLLTGVGGALRDSSPLVAITCNNRLGDLDRDDAQAADHVAIFRPLVKWCKLVSRVEDIRQAIEEGFLRAMAGCPGPVLIDFARDVLEAEVDEAVIMSMPRPGELRSRQPERPSADAARIGDAAAALRQARRPTLWAGNGVKIADASDQVLALAQTLDMPVVTTFNGIGAVPTNHDLVFGPLSRMGTELSSRVLADTDVLLLVGNSLNAVSTRRWSLGMPPTIIQIDVDPTTLGRYYADRTIGVTADARTGLVALQELLGRDAGTQDVRDERRQRAARLARARQQWWSDAAKGVPAESGTMAPDAVMRIVRDIVPDEATAIVDAGNPGVWSYVWEIRTPGTYFKPVGFGNMGFAVPAAIAAAIARPATQVVAFVGDGSLGMSLGELETLAREDVAVCVIVFNDSGYGNIRQEQIIHFEGRTIGVDFGDVDFSAIAKACGIHGERVTDEGSLAAAVTRAVASGRPCLIDVLIDKEINAWTFPLFRHYEVEH